jgi:hypothetical protein
MTGEALSGEFLGPLLRTLAETLDVREVFARISSEARRVVPHDFLILGIMSPDRQRARVIALSGEVPETAEEAVVSPAMRRVLAAAWSASGCATDRAATRPSEARRHRVSEGSVAAQGLASSPPFRAASQTFAKLDGSALDEDPRPRPPRPVEP